MKQNKKKTISHFWSKEEDETKITIVTHHKYFSEGSVSQSVAFFPHSQALFPSHSHAYTRSTAVQCNVSTAWAAACVNVNHLSMVLLRTGWYPPTQWVLWCDYSIWLHSLHSFCMWVVQTISIFAYPILNITHELFHSPEFDAFINFSPSVWKSTPNESKTKHNKKWATEHRAVWNEIITRLQENKHIAFLASILCKRSTNQ